MGIKKAKTKEIKKLTAAELGGAPKPVAELESVYAPQRVKQAVIFQGDAKKNAAQLVEKLKFEVRVI
jgi:electron transfer flavoprotein beta subunit